MGIITATGDTTALDALLTKVWQDSGRDFREYRRGTVARRLERRLLVTGTRSYQEYTQFLDGHPEEYQRLAEYLTIAVSSFFRSKYTYHQINSVVLPRLLDDKRDKRQGEFSIWSAACARGEEPYSIAISLREFLGDRLPDYRLALYATDISREALQRAETGVYPADELEGLPANLAGNYFSRHAQGYTINSNIRQMVTFSCFDLVSAIAPPFSNLDCVFCCNVLIYLQRPLQERVLGMLYQSLATPGYLILGEAETPTGLLSQKLECVDHKARIYRKI